MSLLLKTMKYIYFYTLTRLCLIICIASYQQMEAEREDRKQREALREEERKRQDERRKIEQEKLVCTC